MAEPMFAPWRAVIQQAKKIAFRLPIVGNLMLPRYPFMLEPEQLIWLCEAINRTRDARAPGYPGTGCIVEVGVARGQTSTFLLTHMRHRGDTRQYYCIDTFCGFTSSDIEYEVSQRGKAEHVLFDGFAVNNRALFDANLKRQGFSNVVTIQADASAFDWSNLPPIDVMLIDVDLYKPTMAVLTNSQPYWAPFARIMVDDVKSGTVYDGANQAYSEFCGDRNLPLRTVGNKAGVIVSDEPAESTLAFGGSPRDTSSHSRAGA